MLINIYLDLHCFSVDFCLLLPVSGPCTNNIIRWYYNYAVGRCQEFTYGGCDGNQNNFDTLHDCLQQCGKFFSFNRFD